MKQLNIKIIINKILEKGVKSLVITFVSIGLTFVLNWLLTNYLGETNYGLFTYGFSWVYVFGGVATLGLETVLQKELKPYKEKQQEASILGLFSYSSKVTLFVSLLFVVFFYGIYYLFPTQQNHILFLAAITIPFFGLLQINQTSLVGLEQTEQSFYPEKIVRTILFGIPMAYFLFFNKTVQLQTIVLVNVIAFAMAYLFSLYLVKKHLRYNVTKNTDDKKKWRSMGFTFLAMGGLYLINSRADILMLGLFGYTDKVGIYNISVKISDFVGIPLMLINIALAPYISSYITNSKTDELQQIIKKIIRITFIIGLVFCLPLLLFAEPILLLFGEGFTEGKSILIVLTLMQLTGIVIGPVGYMVTLGGTEKKATKIIAIGTVINIVLNSILIPKYQIMGAVTATIVGFLFWNIAFFLLIKKEHHLNTSIF